MTVMILANAMAVTSVMSVMIVMMLGYFEKSRNM